MPPHAEAHTQAPSAQKIPRVATRCTADMQDLPRGLQILPAAPAPAPLCRCVAAVFRTHGALPPCGARRQPWARRRAQLLGGPSRLAGSRTGYPSPPRRPCTLTTFAPSAGRTRARRIQRKPPTLDCSRRRARVAGLCRRLPPMVRRRRSSSVAILCRAVSEVGAPRPRGLLRLSARGRAGLRALLGFVRRERAHPVLLSSSPAGARLRPAPSSARLAVGRVALVCASPRGGSPPSPRAALRPPPFPRRGCRRPMRIIRAGGRGFAPGPRTFGAVVACIARSLPRRFLCGRLRSLRSLRGLRPLPRPVRAPARAPGSVCAVVSLFSFRWQ